MSTSFLCTNHNHILKYRSNVKIWQLSVFNSVSKINIDSSMDKYKVNTPTEGLEPSTIRLRAWRSTDWARPAWWIILEIINNIYYYIYNFIYIMSLFKSFNKLWVNTKTIQLKLYQAWSIMFFYNYILITIWLIIKLEY